MSFPIEPLYDRVFVKKDEAETTQSGFHLPDSVKGRAVTGTVVAVGKGRYSVEKGEHVPMDVKAGDKVFLKAFDGYVVEIPEHGKVFVFSENEILGVFRK